MTGTVVCPVCGRVVNVRERGEGYAKLWRHLPPDELGQKKVEGAGWFGHDRWCRGSFQAVRL